ASTTPCARAFSPRSNASCSTGAVSKPRPRPAWRSSISSKAGTTPIVATRPSTIYRRSTTKGVTLRKLLPQAQHRPPKRGSSSVVVEDRTRHPAEELEADVVPFAEGFAALGRIGLHQTSIAVRQIHREEVDLAL